MDVRTLRLKISQLRKEADTLARNLMSAESEGSLSPAARRAILKRLEAGRYALRTYEGYCHDLLASEKSSEEFRKEVEGDIKHMQRSVDRTRNELAEAMQSSIPLHNDVYFGLTLYLIDQKTTIGEKNRLLSLMHVAA